MDRGRGEGANVTKSGDSESFFGGDKRALERLEVLRTCTNTSVDFGESGGPTL